jgi:hypothetical protein
MDGWMMGFRDATAANAHPLLPLLLLLLRVCAVC